MIDKKPSRYMKDKKGSQAENKTKDFLVINQKHDPYGTSKAGNISSNIMFFLGTFIQ
jgi:hypothetical protein